jgi:hypothetical protein
VLVLIDGDGMIFQNDLINAGDKGGRKAAGLVQDAVQTYVQRELATVPPNAKVVCRVYANVRGLAGTLAGLGMVDDVDIVEQFARGFTRGKVLFDFVDVGPGKDRADEKIVGKLLNIPSVFFFENYANGCSVLVGP